MRPRFAAADFGDVRFADPEAALIEFFEDFAPVLVVFAALFFGLAAERTADLPAVEFLVAPLAFFDVELLVEALDVAVAPFLPDVDNALFFAVDFVAGFAAAADELFRAGRDAEAVDLLPVFI